METAPTKRTIAKSKEQRRVETVDSKLQMSKAEIDENRDDNNSELAV